MLRSRGLNLLKLLSVRNAPSIRYRRASDFHGDMHGDWREPELEVGDRIKITYYYKTKIPESNEPLADVIGTLMWWWILWHIFTDYHHIIGEDIIYPENWTDEELGIPPDREGL